MVFFIILLGFLSGLSATYLGLGSGLLIVSFLPVTTGFSPLETVQASLLIVFVINGINAGLFIYKKSVLWSWCASIALTGLLFSFLSSFFVASLSPFQVRFILWGILGLLSLGSFVPWGLFFKKKHLPYIFGCLMGGCSGLTGLGGGVVLSPVLHGSGILPARKVAPLICVVTAPVSFFALAGQELGAGFLLSNSFFWWRDCLTALLSALTGLLFGHLLDRRERSRLRRVLARGLTLFLFCALAGEIWIWAS